MNKHTRTPVIAGNWKMNQTPEQAIALCNDIRYGLPYPGEVDIIVAPPFLYLQRLADYLINSYISIAAQDLHYEDKGAFTGECSGSQLKACGADYVIVGHSERRQLFSETDTIVNLKLKAAFRNGLIPILCVGETLEERNRGEEGTVIGRQLSAGLSGLCVADLSSLIIAYEPVWAIGTGKTATPDQVEDVHRMIRFNISQVFGGVVSEGMRILYGGSVKPGNSVELLALGNVDGALVGGASLGAAAFIEIIKNAQ